MPRASHLDRVMLLVAEHLPSGEDLTERVRGIMLDALLHRRGALALPEEAGRALAAWAALERGPQEVDDLYQRMLQREVQAVGDALTIQVRRGGHRRTGAYYTTDLVADYIASQAFRYLPDGRTLIDPACGGGALLQAAHRVRGSALERMVGWDVDPDALRLCGQRLPQAELCCMDALLGDGEGGYDLCLGNPPYVSSGLRGAPRGDAARLSRLRERYGLVATYKLNTYPLFVARGLELLRPGGVLGYILPDSFLTGRYFAGLRQLLLRHTLLELTLIRTDFWRHGRVGQSVILFVRKAPPPPGHRVLIQVCDRPEGLQEGVLEPVALGDLVWGEKQRFRLGLDAERRAVLRRMEQGSRPLRDWLRSYSGLIGRDGQRSLLVAPPARTGAAIERRLLRSGREIDRYRLDWAGNWVVVDPARIKSGGNITYYERPKLLLRQTASSLRAVYDDQGYYCLNNIHLLLPARKETNLRALLGIINSTPLGEYYQAAAMEAGRLYAQVDLDLLAELPAPDLSRAAAARLEEAVQRRETAAPEEAAVLERQIDGLVAELYGLDQRGERVR